MPRIVCAVLFCLVLSPSPVPAQDWGRLAALREEALAAVNEDRKENGLPPLQLTERLNAAAQAHAEDMLERGYYSHTSPEGGTVADRYQARGGSRWQLVEENIARCTGCPVPATEDRVRTFERGWMDSRGHRENILRHGLEGFGFGIAGAEGRPLYAVQTFAGPGTPRGASAEATGALSAREQTEQALRQVNAARRKAGVAPLDSDKGLGTAARALVSDDPEHIVDPEKADGLFELLPQDERTRWRSLQLAAGRCGGCGQRPTAADVKSFVEDWLGREKTRATLLAAELSNLGFAMKANGEGMKSAVLLLARRR